MLVYVPIGFKVKGDNIFDDLVAASFEKPKTLYIGTFQEYSKKVPDIELSKENLEDDELYFWFKNESCCYHVKSIIADDDIEVDKIEIDNMICNELGLTLPQLERIRKIYKEHKK